MQAYANLVAALKAAMEAARNAGGQITGQALEAVNTVLRQLGAATIHRITWDGTAVPVMAVDGGWRNAHSFLDPASYDARRSIA